MIGNRTMPEKDMGMWGYVSVMAGTALGMLGLQGLIVRMQNNKVKDLVTDTKEDIAELKTGKQDIKSCELMHGELVSKIDRVFNSIETMNKTQQKMITQIALLDNGRKRVTSE